MTVPTAAELLDGAIQSLGEPATVAAVTSIAGAADCSSPRGPYITYLKSMRPDKLFFRQVMPDGGSFTAVVNGSSAWSIDPDSQEVSPLDDRAISMILGHDFLMLPLLLEGRFVEPETAGTARYGDVDCYQITVADYLGLPCELFLARDSMRLRGITHANPMNPEVETIRITFVDWQEAEGLSVPLTVSIRDNSGEFRFDFRPVTLNSVAEDIFAIPESLKT